MGFQRARTDKHIQERINEIISAASEIYDASGYDGLNFSAISKLTKFTRPTIYKYFNTKEEILLKILVSDAEFWVASLTNSFKLNKIYSIGEIADIWVDTMSKNYRLLNLYSMLYTTIEKNVSLEALVEFKKAFLNVQESIVTLVSQLFPKAAMDDIESFLVNHLALALGLYPMSQLCELQIKAIELTGVHYTPPDFKAAFKSNLYQQMYCLEHGIHYKK